MFHTCIIPESINVEEVKQHTRIKQSCNECYYSNTVVLYCDKGNKQSCNKCYYSNTLILYCDKRKYIQMRCWYSSCPVLWVLQNKYICKEIATQASSSFGAVFFICQFILVYKEVK